MKLERVNSKPILSECFSLTELVSIGRIEEASTIESFHYLRQAQSIEEKTMYYRVLACLMAVSMMQAYADSTLAERGGGAREGGAHSEHHPEYHNHVAPQVHPYSAPRTENIDRNIHNYNEFNRGAWDGAAAGWEAGALAVPPGEYVYPTNGQTPTNGQPLPSSDMNTLYDQENTAPQ
jgi:hypothetical protein